MNDDMIYANDLKYVWHPASQMKDYEENKPLIIIKARGSRIFLNDGRSLIDGISSWWCKSLGHNHPVLKAALIKQTEKFEHVIFANTTSSLAIDLSQKLASLKSGLNKVFYASDGSSAIEIALKMSLHARVNNQEKQRTQVIALQNSYHGETLGALSVSDVGLYKNPYKRWLLPTFFIQSIPYVNTVDDPRWNDSEAEWDRIEKTLKTFEKTATAVIIEPIVQGAGGMKIYSQDFLKRLSQWTQKHNIHLIADEIMTGLGRTGKMLACDHAEIIPDFICLSKGLTSGWLPLSAVLVKDDIYSLFYEEVSTQKAFLHSHTYSGNALGMAVALATLSIIEEKKLADRAQRIGQEMLHAFQTIADDTGTLSNVRGLGAIVAAEIKSKKNGPRLAFQVCQEAIKRGALLRPLGNTIYWIPPLTIPLTLLRDLKDITQEALRVFC